MKENIMDDYGKELIVDIHNCGISKFNRRDLAEFFGELCDLIDMRRGPLYFWDYVGFEEERENDPDHLVGTSAVQFISTSNITIHTLDKLARVYLNVFSCKDFHEDVVIQFSKDWFGGEVVNSKVVRRI